MKKIINGKVYNTDTAQLIADWANSYASNDFHYCEESLHRTKFGQYFIAGFGGAMTSYQTSAGSNSWGGGSEIRLLSEVEALQWCEERDIDPEVVAANFQVEEG